MQRSEFLDHPSYSQRLSADDNSRHGVVCVVMVNLTVQEFISMKSSATCADCVLLILYCGNDSRI